MGYETNDNVKDVGGTYAVLLAKTPNPFRYTIDDPISSEALSSKCVSIP